MIHDLGKRSIGNVICPKSAQGYARRLIRCANREEGEAYGQKLRTRTAMLKDLGLTHKRKKKSDPRFTRFMLHKIYCMYSYINNKEEINYDMLLTSMS